MLKRIIDIEKYYQVYNRYPNKSFEGQRHYKEFCKLLDKYTLNDLIDQQRAPISKVNQLVDNNNQHYEIKAVTNELLVSHLKLIHEKWNIVIPNIGWWDKAIKAQAKGMLRDYSKKELHYFMHNLENEAWYSQHINKAFTFKLVRRYIENEQKRI